MQNLKTCSYIMYYMYIWLRVHKYRDVHSYSIILHARACTQRACVRKEFTPICGDPYHKWRAEKHLNIYRSLVSLAIWRSCMLAWEACELECCPDSRMFTHSYIYRENFYRSIQENYHTHHVNAFQQSSDLCRALMWLLKINPHCLVFWSVSKKTTFKPPRFVVLLQVCFC